MIPVGLGGGGGMGSDLAVILLHLCLHSIKYAKMH